MRKSINQLSAAGREWVKPVGKSLLPLIKPLRESNYIQEAPYLFLLALCYGVYAFFICVLATCNGNMTEKSEWFIFTTGCVLIPLVGVLASLWARQALIAGNLAIYSALLLANSLVLLELTYWLRASQSYFLVSCSALLAGLLINLTIPAICRRCSVQSADVQKRILDYIAMALPFIGIFILIDMRFALRGIALRHVVTVTLIAFALVICHATLFQRRSKSLRLSWVDVLVCLGLILLLSNTAAPNSDGRHHHNFYLGPVNDLFNGKSLLSDIYCQYGVFSIYFLAGVFSVCSIPVSYQGLAAIITVMTIAQYIILWFLLKHVLRSRAFSAVVLSAIVLVNIFAQQAVFINWPSTGPLRFGIPYLLLIVIMARNIWPRRQAVFRMLEYALVTIASVWSVETLVYTLGVFLGVLVYEGLVESSNPRQVARIVTRGIGMALGFIAGACALLALEMRWRLGEWPQLGCYLEYLNLIENGYTCLLIRSQDPWALFGFIYFASILAIAYRLLARGREQPPEQKIALGMTLFGVAQFSYYVTRSHYNNLYHIAIPAIFVAAYWLMEATRNLLKTQGKLRWSLPLAGYLVLAHLIVSSAIGPFSEKVGDTGLFWVLRTTKAAIEGTPPNLGKTFDALCSPPRSDPRVDEAMALIAKYNKPDSARAAVLIHPDLTTETLMLSHKSNAFPISHFTQDQLAPSAKRRALEFCKNLRPGDIIFVDTNASQLARLERELLDELSRKFVFKIEERTKHEIVAARIISEKPEK